MNINLSNNGVIVLGILLVTILATLLFYKPHSRIPNQEERMIVAKYDALPETAKKVLLAKNLVGMTVFQKTTDQSPCTIVFETFLINGAKRAGDEKSADLVIIGKKRGYKNVDVTIKDRFSNTFFASLDSNHSGSYFAQEVADSLGVENKITKMEAQHRKMIMDSHKQVLGLK